MLTYNECKEFKNTDSPSGRTYSVPTGVYPSITTVLGATSDNGWLSAWRQKIGDEEADKILADASARGTKIHSYIEQLYTEYSKPTITDARKFFSELDITNEPDYIIKMAKNLTKILVDNNYHSIAQEFVVWDDELKIAGRCDSIGYWNGAFTLVDFKTARKKKSRAHITNYFLQATAYCKAHNRLFEEKVNRFVIVMVNEEGTSQIFTGTPNQYIPDLRYRVNKFYIKKGIND